MGQVCMRTEAEEAWVPGCRHCHRLGLLGPVPSKVPTVRSSSSSASCRASQMCWDGEGHVFQERGAVTWAAVLSWTHMELGK